ncbi:MAG: LysM peptidoglycan-binding domain-containing protein, partial [Anaerolineae bacterium]
MDARQRESVLPIALVLAALVALTALAAVLPRAAGQPTVASPTPAATAMVESPSPSPRPTRTPSPTLTATPTPTFSPLPPIIHIVQKGESVGIIAKQYGVPERAVLEANGLEADSIIRIGQELIIPRPTPTPEPAATLAPQSTPASTPSATGAAALAPGEQAYTVESGDTLSGIAKKFGTNVNLLMTRNNIKDPSLLRVGQTIIIPAGTPTPLPTPTFRPTSTPTPGPPYPAPALLWPPDGTVFRGESAVVLVQWASVGLLAADEWYVVRVYRGSDVVG